MVTMRAGKTKIAVDKIKRDKPKTILWVSPSNELLDQLEEEFSKWKAKAHFKKVTTLNWASLGNHVGHYDLIVLDEEQKITPLNSTSLRDKTLTADSILSMTGTPTRDPEKKKLLDELGIKPYFVYNTDEAIDDGVVSDYIINVVKIPYNAYGLGTYRWYQAKIDELKVGRYHLEGRGLQIKFTESGKTVALKLYTKSSDKPGNLFALFNTIFNAGYLVLDDDKGVLASKIVLGNNTYFLQLDGTVTKKIPKEFLLGRQRSLGVSKLKTVVAQRLLAKWEQERVLIFVGNSTAQAEEICPHSFHSGTDNSSLQEFTKHAINHIAMVNSGSVGFTYRDLDKLLLLQVDSDKNGTTSQKIARSTLYQGEDYVASIWILCVMGTEDERWVQSFVEKQNRRTVYHDYKDL